MKDNKIYSLGYSWDLYYCDLNRNVSPNIFARPHVILGLYTVEIENYDKKRQ